MIVDQARLSELMVCPARTAAAGELRRVGNLFLVGGLLPPQETLESLFDSHCQAQAELFHLAFGGRDSFRSGEEMARQIKKNFHTHLAGRLDFPASPDIIERAYVAGVDIIDLPLGSFDPVPEGSQGEMLQSLGAARSVFPRWRVASTLVAGDDPLATTRSAIDFLLAEGVVPLVELSAGAARFPVDEVAALFRHLDAAFERHRVALKPLLPLLGYLTPLVVGRPAGALRGFIDRIHDRQLLATSDLRRSLRVRQVEESFESSGL
jgi:hypothetical protein